MDWWPRVRAPRPGAGADGLLVEVRTTPDREWSDDEQLLDFAEFDAMMTALKLWIELRANASSQERLEEREFALKCPANGAI